MDNLTNYELLLQLLEDFESDRGKLKTEELFKAYASLNNIFMDYMNEVIFDAE